MIALQLLLGWLIADLISGFLHWLEDRVLWVGMPLISKSVVEPNRLHHDKPYAFLSGSFLSRNGTTWMAIGIVAAAWFVLFGFSYIWLGAICGGLVVSEVHALAHRYKNYPAIFKVLQEIGLIQSSAHHSGHHRRDHDQRYCILTNWINPWLDWIGVWSAMEWILTTIGLEPNRGTK
jgi:Lipid desaturase domain